MFAIFPKLRDSVLRGDETPLNFELLHRIIEENVKKYGFEDTTALIYEGENPRNSDVSTVSARTNSQQMLEFN
jgi:hypothetical protein